MLNLFPIQFLAPLAYTLLRICVGIILIRLGIKRIRNRVPQSTLVVGEVAKRSHFSILIIGTGEIIAGTLITLGLFTQAGALIALTIAILHMRQSPNTEPSLPRVFYVLLFFASLSLFITGAGIFAFDLPI
jgi:uncharacterized membrane protein YphA (DoxX/SURF4 family)